MASGFFGDVSDFNKTSTCKDNCLYSNINLKFCNNIFRNFQLHFTYLFTGVPTPVNHDCHFYFQLHFKIRC